ncbi:MAG: hypothetical protein RR808_06430 [Akkermansia sp.]
MLTRWSIFLLSSLALMSQTSGAVDSAIENPPVAKIDKKIPGLELMPPGSKLKNVSLPRYEGLKLTLLVTSTQMTVVSPREIKGERVLAYLYDPNHRNEMQMSMKDASFFFDTKILVSRGETTINDPRFQALSQGVIFDSQQKKGFMRGPVTTKFYTNELIKKDS